MKNQRVDQKLATEFAKNADFETVLTSLNNALSIEEEKLLLDKGDVFPTLHILGAPRSGTTLANQLLLSYLKVGYINNFIATFWKAPTYGIELSKKLLGDEYVSNFKSTYGRTDSIREPHEFGYFWNHHLKYGDLHQHNEKHEQKIPWSKLRHILNNMTYRFDSPVVFKSFLFGFHANRAFQEIPKTCFVYIKRDFLSNAFSILKLRKKLNGNIHEWGSIKPLQYEKLKDLSVYEQIAGQILCMESEYLNQLEGIPKENKAFFQYESLCEHPSEFVQTIKTLLANHYDGPKKEVPIIPSFQTVTVNDYVEQQKEMESLLEAKIKIKKMFPELREMN